MEVSTGTVSSCDVSQTLDASQLAQLAQEKEKEWRQIQDLRNKSLESTLKQRDNELKQEKEKLFRLKEDFKYNLRLLNDRDAELATYDTTITDLRRALVTKDAEISDLTIKLHDVQTANSREGNMRDELQKSYQKRIREKQAELEQYRLKKDAELEEERKELNSFRRNLQKQISEIEEELDLQKRELTAGFDDAMKKREHEFRHELDEMNTKVLSHELKVKILTKELEMSKMNQTDCTSERDKAEGQQRHLEKELKSKEWQLQDVSAMKNAKIAELEGKIKTIQQSMKRQEEDHIRKLNEMDRSIREKEAAIKTLKGGIAEREKKTEDKLRGLESKLEEGEMKLRQLEWAKKDSEKELQSRVDRLTEELTESQHQVEKLLGEKAKVSVTQEMETHTLREREQQLEIQLQECKRHIDRYKHELQDALEHQTSLEQSKSQLELDWQKRLEEVERDQYERSEDLVKSLMQAKKEAQADLAQKEREVSDKDDLIKVLTDDRNRALATIKQYGLAVDQNIDLSTLTDLPQSSADQIQKLQEQNGNLRDVIHQMRDEMQRLGEQLPQKIKTTNQPNPVASEYVKNLENELQNWKTKYRLLKEDETKPTEDAESAVLASDNALIQNHVSSLNNTISQLRSEKVELSAQLKKQQTRLHHLETCVDESNKNQMEKQVQVEQMQYELGAAERRHNAEIVSLRRQVTEIQLQLEEARKEADEYYKANLKNNQHVSNMEQELSNMKMELANKRQPLTFGAQELLIQQLKDEIERMQLDLRGGQLSDNLTYPNKTQTWANPSEIGQLNKKLQQAAKHISQLAKDKQQLIEVNNRLRAELNRNGLKPTTVPRPAPPPPMRTTNDKTGDRNLINNMLDSKLKQLEQLQYEITKQQLGQNNSSKQVQVLHLSDSDEETQAPKSILKNSGPQEIPVKLERPTQFSDEAATHFDIPRPDTADSEKLVRPSTAKSDFSQRSSGQLLQLSGGGISMSSLGGQSLQDIWQMLDQEGPSPRLTPAGPGIISPSPMNVNSSSSESLTIKGKQPMTISQRPQRDTQLSKKTAGRVVTANKPTKQKIRNYNLREDT